MSNKEEIIRKLEQKYKELSETSTSSHCSMPKLRLEGERKEYVKFVDEFIGLLGRDLNLKNSRILEIGSGFGDFSIELSRRSKKVKGIEPEKIYFEISELKKKYYSIENVEFANAHAENIPYKDEEFDIVTSKTVLEHVSDLDKSISEIARVTKKGGIVYTEAPNYFWIKEGHYNVFMLPLMPRFLFKIYLSLIGKDPTFLDGLNYITPSKIEKLLEKYGFESKNIYLDKLRKILVGREFEKVSTANKSYLKIIRLLYFLRINGLIYWIFSKSQFYPTILLISKKK